MCVFFPYFSFLRKFLNRQNGSIYKLAVLQPTALDHISRQKKYSKLSLVRLSWNLIHVRKGIQPQVHYHVCPLNAFIETLEYKVVVVQHNLANIVEHC